MNALLLAVLLVLLVLFAIALVAVATVFFGAKQVHKGVKGRQELLPGVPSAAPLAWNGSPKREAVQHRRLVKAMKLARQVHSGQDFDALGHHAVAIERELTLAALLPVAERKRALDQTETLLSEVERLGHQRYTETSGADDVREGLNDLRERLRLMAEARRELG